MLNKYHATVKGRRLKYNKDIDDYDVVFTALHTLSDDTKYGISDQMNTLAEKEGYDEVEFINGWTDVEVEAI